MVSEILLREALQALSIPLTEATVRSSRKIAAHEVDKLTNYYLAWSPMNLSCTP